MDSDDENMEEIVEGKLPKTNITWNIILFLIGAQMQYFVFAINSDFHFLATSRYVCFGTSAGSSSLSIRQAWWAHHSRKYCQCQGVYLRGKRATEMHSAEEAEH